MYLTYDEYLTFGGTVDEAAFDNLEFEARTIIDWWTYNSKCIVGADIEAITE